MLIRDVSNKPTFLQLQPHVSPQCFGGSAPEYMRNKTASESVSLVGCFLDSRKGSPRSCFLSKG
jgi:hypothetical protein